MITWYIILILTIIIVAIDASCRFFLEKVIVDYKNKIVTGIVGYNIYRYLKWKKEMKNKNEYN